MKDAHARVVLRTYPYWYYAPAGIIFIGVFIVPTVLAFYFSLTRWSLFDSTFIGFTNYKTFLTDAELLTGLKNTVIYAVLTSGFKVILALPLAALLTSPIIRLKGLLRSIVFFPTLVSTVAVGVTFVALMRPTGGLINTAIAFLGAPQPDWLGDPRLALYSVAIVDIWRGIGIALVIFMAGILSIPTDYFDAARLEGGNWVKFRHIILPLSRNATFTVILLSLIGGLRSFDLIFTMTQGGPGFASEVLTSVIYKEYGAGFYGLSTAGNVVLFVMVSAIAYPMMRFFNKREIEL